MTDFSKRQIEYFSDTQFGNNRIMQEKWELQIKTELNALKEFASKEK